MLVYRTHRCTHWTNTGSRNIENYFIFFSANMDAFHSECQDWEQEKVWIMLFILCQMIGGRLRDSELCQESGLIISACRLYRLKENDLPFMFTDLEHLLPACCLTSHPRLKEILNPHFFKSNFSWFKHLLFMPLIFNLVIKLVSLLFFYRTIWSDAAVRGNIQTMYNRQGCWQWSASFYIWKTFIL